MRPQKRIPQTSWILPKICLLLMAQSLPGNAEELAGPIQQILSDRCFDCHDSDAKKGGVDLESKIDAFDPKGDHDFWVKVESNIAKGKMPPPKKTPLAAKEEKAFADWFENEYVLQGGIQHAGPNHPRRLTREELQNTLEDILLIDLREPVTNSRLHIIPDTIIEKFFVAGVYGDSGFSNDALTLGSEPADVQTYARCLSLVLSRIEGSEKAMERLFGMTIVPEKMPKADARLIIDKFGQSAFRRSLTGEESDAFAAVYEKMAKTRSAAEAIKSSMLAILLSPSFFYRFEESAGGQVPVTSDELAVRLSYFLWSAPPDDTLWEIAASGDLQKPEVLKQQVQRMLADPRRISLAENLGGEWFDYKKLRQQSAINKRSDKMAGFYRTQYEEALLFFDSIIRYDEPIFSLVDADWGYSNRHQTGIYRLKTVEKTFDAETALPPINLHYRNAERQVEQGNYEYKHLPLALVGLTDADRGGFVTIGSTLSATSTQNRTSPIRRGVWVMERILGEHFEPPVDIPDLEESEKKAKDQQLNLSPNEILKLHSSQPGCASCHKYIDPIGFGLEGFDQVGVSRPFTVANPAGEKHHWTPEVTPLAYADLSWDVARSFKAGVEVRILFKWTNGRHRLDIKNVRLESGETSLADAHGGYTGTGSNNNVWYFTIPEGAPSKGWQLTAEVKGSGGTDSNGVITVALPEDRTSRTLPNGKSFTTPGELKQLLVLDYRKDVTDNAIRRVLAYALGRKIQPIDRPALEQIKESIATQDYRMTALIESVVLSYPFRHKETE